MKLLRTTTLLAAVLVAAVIFTAGPASAGPIPGYTPDYRGDPNSVHVIFDYAWDPTSGVYWNTTTFDPEPGGYPLDSTQPVASSDGANTQLQLPNFIDDLEVKHMRIQMFFDSHVSSSFLWNNVLVEGFGASGSYQVDIVEWSMPVVNNFHYVDIDIWPNPEWEQVLIIGDFGEDIYPGDLYRIEIDTVSVPEPATMSLLALGGLALIRRKRNK